MLHCDIDRIHYNKKVYDMSFLGRVLKSEVKKERKNHSLKHMFIKHKKREKGVEFSNKMR